MKKCILLGFFLVLASRFVVADENSTRQFQEELLPKIAKSSMLDNYAKLPQKQVLSSTTSVFRKGRKVLGIEQTNTITYFDENHVVLESESDNGKGEISETINIYNTNYDAGLKKGEGGLHIESIIPIVDPIAQRSLVHVRNRIRKFPAPMADTSLTINDLFEDSKYTVDAQELSDGNWKITAENNLYDEKNVEVLAFKKIELILAANLEWRLVESTTTTATTRTLVKYVFEDSNSLFRGHLTEIESEEFDLDGNLRRSDSIKSTEATWETSPLTKDACFLTHYGFEEPPEFAKTKKNSVPVWTIVLGCIFVLGVFLIWKSKK
jgi:hypothetical protein